MFILYFAYQYKIIYYICGLGLQNFNTCLSGVLFTPDLVSDTMNIWAILDFKSGERRINREKIFEISFSDFYILSYSVAY